MIIASYIRSALGSIRRTLENAAAARQLHGMTDHQLRDIGIARDQIEGVVYGDRPAASPARSESGLLTVTLSTGAMGSARG